MPTPNTKIAAVKRNGRNESFAISTARRSATPPMTVTPRSDQHCAIETEPCRQFRRQHAGPKHQDNDAGEQQAKRDRRESKMFEEHARRPPRKPQTSRRSEAASPGRHNEPGIPDQAKIGTANRNRIHRTVSGPIGFTDQRCIGQQGAEWRKLPQKQIPIASRRNDQARCRAKARSPGRLRLRSLSMPLLLQAPAHRTDLAQSHVKVP